MSYLAEQITDGARGAWMLSDAAGASTMVDSSGNARNGTHTLDGCGFVPMIGTATGTDFNGFDSFASVTGATWMDAANMTIEAVARPFRNSVLQTLAHRDSATTSNRTWQFRVNASGKLEYLFWDAGGTVRTVTGATTVTRYAKIHGAATYNGSNAYVYLNGTQDGTLALTSTIRTPVTPPNLEIGRVNTSGGTSAFWNGQIAGVGFYGTALSAARIAVHAAAFGSGANSYDGSGAWGLAG
jgi:hypothetical protein